MYLYITIGWLLCAAVLIVMYKNKLPMLTRLELLMLLAGYPIFVAIVIIKRTLERS